MFTTVANVLLASTKTAFLVISALAGFLVFVFKGFFGFSTFDAFAGFAFTSLVFFASAFFIRFFGFRGRMPFSASFARFFGAVGVMFAAFFGLGVFFAFAFNPASFSALFPIFKSFFASFLFVFLFTLGLTFAFRNHFEDQIVTAAN